jgi:hypothetical protein
MSDFGQSPAFPLPVVYDPSREQINAGAEYGHAAGLNIQQHVWLSIFTAAIAQGADRSIAGVFADAALPDALKALEQLA